MPSVIIKPNAEKGIIAVAQFIESKNTQGGGAKWTNSVIDFIISYSEVKIIFPLCRNTRFAKRKYSCIVFRKKWVIVFKKSSSAFTVHYFIYGPKLR